MKLMRRLVLPVAIGSVATTVATGLLGGRAIRELTQGDPSTFLETAAFMGGFILIGLVTIGLPLAVALRRRRINFAVCLPLLLIVGAMGGAVMAAVLELAWNQQADLLSMAAYASFGAPIGVAAALIWTLLNGDLFGPDPAPL